MGRKLSGTVPLIRLSIRKNNFQEENHVSYFNDRHRRTIACCETAHGLSPALDSAALLGALPELSALCTVETLDLMQLDSTDVTAADRQRMTPGGLAKP